MLGVTPQYCTPKSQAVFVLILDRRQLTAPRISHVDACASTSDPQRHDDNADATAGGLVVKGKPGAVEVGAKEAEHEASVA